MGRIWRIPADDEKRTPKERDTLKLLNRFIDTACDILEARGYVVLKRKQYSNHQWFIETVYVGRSDLVKSFLNEVRKGYERLW